MMKCKSIQNLLPDYLFGELDEKLEIHISEHLIECGECKREVQTLERLFDAIKSEYAVEPTRDVYDRIRIGTGMERRTSLAVLRKPIRLYHALATLILGIILASLTNVTYDKYATRSKVMKENHETLHRSSDSDSITFYTAPSHRIGGT